MLVVNYLKVLYLNQTSNNELLIKVVEYSTYSIDYCIR